MALANYSDLVTAIGNWLDDSTLTDRIPEFISLAEAEFSRRLRTDDMVATTTVTASSENTALPSGFNGLLAIDVDGSPDRQLERMSLPELKRAYSTDDTGKPFAYAIADGKFWWGPVPDSSYTVNLIYSATIPGLQANTTNWLMTAHPDLYLFGALLQAEFFGWNDTRLPLLKARVDELLDQINTDSVKKTAGASPIYPRGVVAQTRGVRI